MRLLLNLKCIDSTQRQETDNHYQSQSFIYSLLENSRQFSNLHNKRGYKFFCFSNIFAPAGIKDNDTDKRYVLISSPSKDFIKHIEEMLTRRKESKDPIKIGNMQLMINDMRTLETELRLPFTLITGTPIVMRISRERYQKYEIETKCPYDYVYWKKEYPLEMFTQQLEENLRAKYTEFTDNELLYGPIIRKLVFRKQISTRIYLHDTEQIVIGSLREFSFDVDSNTDLLQFGLDCGLGERNSMGFGFMNVKRTS